MLEKILRFGMTFDWISPVLAMAQDIVNGPSHTFMIPEDCGWSGREISRLLRSRGVKTWGHMMVNGTFMITVPKAQVKWAQYLLDRAGLGTGSSLPDTIAGGPDNGAEGATPSPPQKKSQRGSLGDTLRDLADFRL